MEISLDEAIEIHARALTKRLRGEAPLSARDRAADLEKVGDREGHSVWMRVAETSERLLDETQPAAEASLGR